MLERLPGMASKREQMGERERERGRTQPLVGLLLTNTKPGKYKGASVGLVRSSKNLHSRPQNASIISITCANGAGRLVNYYFIIRMGCGIRTLYIETGLAKRPIIQ